MKKVKDMVAEANAVVDHAPATDLLDQHGAEGVTFVDLRDPRELEREGMIPCAFHCPRGMLEFWIDPESPYHKDIFNQDKTYVFYCAGALRSALATQVAQEMGLTPVAHIEGGFALWKKSGGQIETVD